MATAGGKVLLLGEHAVVYGVTAIAAGLEHGARAHAKPSTSNRLFVNRQEVTGEPQRDEARAFAALLERLGVFGVRIDAEIDLPIGVGLGASACLGVAVARAVLAQEPDVEGSARAVRVLEAANAWEQVFHGNPSGVDAAAAYHGGCLRFSTKRGVEPLMVGHELRLAVALAGPAASTKKMVERVAGIRQNDPTVFENVLTGIAELVEAATKAIQTGDARGLGELLDRNQVLLSALSLSTPEIEQACTLARRAGALGAKLTGSGGGGAVVALVEADTEAAVLTSFRRNGIECFASTVHVTPSEPLSR